MNLNPFTNPNLFLWLITGMFAINALTNLFARDYRMATYCLAASVVSIDGYLYGGEMKKRNKY